MTQYCTHPAERQWTPGDSPVLPEADTCDHDECRPGTRFQRGGVIPSATSTVTNTGDRSLVLYPNGTFGCVYDEHDPNTAED